MPAATYCRISYDPKGTEAGVERQQVDTDRLAADLGYEVVERIVDNDRSASRKARTPREGFDRLLDLPRRGSIDAVIVYDLDRFTRNPDQLGAWIDVADSTGLKIHTTGDLVNLSDADSIFKARILLAVAEKEAANISRRVTARARHDAEIGRPHWSIRPFGFERDGTHVPVEAEELSAMYADVIAGRSLASISKDLNKRGVENSTGARWQSATIGFLIRGARNAGLRTYRGEIVGSGTWEPIVSEQTWRDAVAALDARRVGRRRPARSLLGGVVICSGCGKPMSRSGRQYRCIPRSDGYRTTCSIAVAGDAIDAYVTALVLEAVGDVEPADRSPADGGDVSRMRADVVRLREHLDELAAMFGRGEIGLSEYKAAKQPIDVRLSAAEGELSRADARAALERMTGPATTLADRWDDLDLQLRARIVGTLIEGIDVAKADRPGQRFTPDRLTVRWAA